MECSTMATTQTKNVRSLQLQFNALVTEFGHTPKLDKIIYVLKGSNNRTPSLLYQTRCAVKDQIDELSSAIEEVYDREYLYPSYQIDLSEQSSEILMDLNVIKKSSYLRKKLKNTADKINDHVRC